jgi:hypothetical protein
MEDILKYNFNVTEAEAKYFLENILQVQEKSIIAKVLFLGFPAKEKSIPNPKNFTFVFPRFSFFCLDCLMKTVSVDFSWESSRCSIEKFIELALTLFFKRQQHRKLSWSDKDSDKDQSQFDELFN